MKIFIRSKVGYERARKVCVEVDPSEKVGSLKEKFKKAIKGAPPRMQELFLDNKTLSDDRSIAFYNIPENSIIETCSNPLWAAMFYAIVNKKKADEGNFVDGGKLAGLYQIIGKLFNSKSEKTHQLPHFASIEELAANIKGIGPATKEKLEKLYNDYLEYDAMHSDPVGHFVERVNASISGNALNTSIEDFPDEESKLTKSKSQNSPNSNNNSDGPPKKKRKTNDAGYCPKPFSAPFAMLAGLHKGTLQSYWSLSEEQLKQFSQFYTNTDLYDKTPGTRFGGFDSMENTLISKNLVRKEDVDAKYSILPEGRAMAQKCFQFAECYNRWKRDMNFEAPPSVHINEELILLIDDREPNSSRLAKAIGVCGIKAEIKSLKMGDYLWVLRDAITREERILHYVIERKTWDDLSGSMEDLRILRQSENMSRSLLGNCIVVVEGSIKNRRSKRVSDEKLMEAIHKMHHDLGFFIRYNPTYKATEQFLITMTDCIKKMVLEKTYLTPKTEDRIMQNITTVQNYPKPQIRESHVWTSDIFVQFATNESTRKEWIPLLKSTSHQDRVVLVIQGLERYIKNGNSILNSLFQTMLLDNNPIQNADVLKKITEGLPKDLGVPESLIDYWLVWIETTLGCYVKRTETDIESQEYLKRFHIVMPTLLRTANLDEPISSSRVPQVTSPPPLIPHVSPIKRTPSLSKPFVDLTDDVDDVIDLRTTSKVTQSNTTSTPTSSKPSSFHPIFMDPDPSVEPIPIPDSQEEDLLLLDKIKREQELNDEALAKKLQEEEQSNTFRGNDQQQRDLEFAMRLQADMTPGISTAQRIPSSVKLESSTVKTEIKHTPSTPTKPILSTAVSQLPSSLVPSSVVNNMTTSATNPVTTPTKTRKTTCRACGAEGHTRADKRCPQYNSTAERERRDMKERAKEEKRKKEEEEEARREELRRKRIEELDNTTRLIVRQLDNVAQLRADLLEEERNKATKKGRKRK